MNRPDVAGVMGRQWSAEAELRDLPGERFAHPLATGEMVHEFGRGSIGDRFCTTGKQNLAVFTQSVAMLVGIMVGAHSIKFFQTKGQRLKLGMASGAFGIGDALLGDGALGKSNLGGHRRGVHARWRGLHHAPQQIVKNEESVPPLMPRHLLL